MTECGAALRFVGKQANVAMHLGGDRTMGRFLIVAISALMLVGCDFSPPPSPDARLKPPVDQGPNWTLAARKSFYSTDQGSRLMPLSWFMALKQADGRPFLPAEEGLSRYGYLKNHEDPTTILPVGFTVNKMDGLPDAIGMSCAACHTREIVVEGKPYRIDGGPAIADFQSFM